MAFDDLSSLLLIGCGKMGGALLDGWLAGGLAPGAVSVLDPAPPPEVDARLSALKVARARPASPPRVLLLAVKPQIMQGVLEDVAPLAGPGTLVLSVAAGWTIAGYEAAFGAGTAIIRAMPNTPAAVGRGITACAANAAASPADRALATALLEAVGRVVWVEDEGLIDAVTGVSGSGPAYVFHMVEALTAAGIAEGLPADVAATLARATVEGAGELLHRSPELSPETLRRNVTSPNGTTQAGLEVLMDPAAGLTDLMRRTVAAATRRSRALSA